MQLDLPLRIMFEKPTIAGLAQALAAQVDQKNVQPEAPPIQPVPRDQTLPLSFAQQRLWFLDQLQPNNPLYNIPRTLRMRGPLDAACLERSINEIVRRHEALRTTFTSKQGEPAQVVAPSLVLPLSQRDLTALPQAEREAQALELAREEARLPFNLAHGPLLRATLLQLSPDDHVLLLTMHHITSDAWSAGIFMQELSTLYEAFLAGKPSPLPDLAIQYPDYAAWQRQWLRDDVLAKQLDYWRTHLQGAPPVLVLPADRPRAQAQSFRGTYQEIPLAVELSQEIKQFSQREGVTPFMTLLAGFKTLLARYTGQEHVVVGTDLANRTTVETEKLIGFFINLLALHTDLSGNPTFRELLGRVKETALGAYAHQDMPFDKLVEELQPERNLSHNPIVQILFVMQNIPRQRRTLAGLDLSPFDVEITRSKFDLAVFMVENGQGLAGQWLYSTDLFDASTIQRMARHFEILMGSAMRSPESRLSSLEMLTAAEKQQQGAEKQERKQSQIKKLMNVAPKAVTLSNTSGEREE